MEHRLAAILSADAAGYTRLLAEDEPATLRAIAEARAQIAAGVGAHGGRVVDAPGDNVLAEFRSACDALLCSVALQRSLRERAAPLPETRRLLYRMGLHLGDVAVEAEHIYGDGVNVAARLQALAEPGGICLSAAVHENVQGRIDLPFDDLGEQRLKNFPRPVRAFRLVSATAPTSEPPPLEPPDRPSLVVLPFANVSGDAEQEYFADGMSEDLIAELARVPALFVIGRGTSFAYKGRNVVAREIGRELGVRHVVEGSVRRSGTRVRITARLTAASTGQELWSERYDREMGDVFALQDEVVGGLVAGLRRELGAGIEHKPRGRPVRAEVWEMLVQGRAQIDLGTVESQLRGCELLQRCVALDPQLASGWAELARSEHLLYFLGADGGGYLEQGFEHVRRALELDPEEPVAHLAHGNLLSVRGDHEAAVVAGRRCVELAPSRADLQMWLGSLLIQVRRPEEALTVLRNLTRLDPALRHMHLFQVATCYRRLGRIDEAIAKHRECVAAKPDFFGAHMNLAAIHAELGELNQARASLAEVLRLRPDFSIAAIPRLPSGRDFLVDNLRKLGVPE